MATSRAAALLESLSGRDSSEERDSDGNGLSSGTWRRIRDQIAAVTGAPHGVGGEAGAAQPWRTTMGRAAVAVVLLLSLLLGWRLLARPAPLADRLPMVSRADALRVGSRGADDPVDTSRGKRTSATDGSDEGGSDNGGSDKGRSPRGGPAGGESEQPALITVHVAGAVAAPGVVQLPPDSRVVAAVAAAGGLRPEADPDRVNLAATLADGVRIVIPVKGLEPPAEVPVLSPVGGSSGSSTAGAGPTDGTPATRTNVNTADVQELQKLPGVGPATAAAIVAQREKSGPFRSVDDLLEVRGIGEVKLEGMRDLVTVG